MSMPLAYALIATAALMATLKVVFQNDFMRKFGKNMADMSLYLSCVFFLIAIFMLFTLDYDNPPSWFTVILGVAFGVLAMVSQVCYSIAMKNGPVSISVLIVNFALILPILTGLMFWGEEITLMQIFGLAVLSVAMVLILYHKPEGKVQKKENKKSAYVIWLVFIILTYFGLGLNSVLQVWHQKTDFKEEFNWFVMISYAVAGLSALIALPVSGKKISFKMTPRVGIDMVCGAAALGLHNYIKPIVARYVDGAILQSVTNILNIIFITVFGVLLFKDKITKPQWVGIAVSVVAIVLLCI